MEKLPSDVNSFFKVWIVGLWEKANKRQTIKAKRMRQQYKVLTDVVEDYAHLETVKEVPNQNQQDSFEDNAEENKLEDVRMSNFAFSQSRISEFISFYFAVIGVGCAVVASELAANHNENNETGDWVVMMEMLCNISTIPLMINIILNKIMMVRWLRFKLIYSDLDNIFNTGHFKWAIFEMVLMLIMPYPFLHNYVYREESNDFTNGIDFQWNDLLLCFMIFCRLVYVMRTILNLSYYTEPRAQRVCAIYGIDASYSFAMKALMKQDSWLVLIVTMLITCISMSYQLRLFEQKVQHTFIDITTPMWNYMITMLTIGYGDIYAKSHMGRLIAIVIGGWGAFYSSLFVVALTNMLEFDAPQTKAFNLLQRLDYKDQLRVESAGALAAAFRLKLIRKAPQYDINAEIKQLRAYRNHMQEFQMISKQIRNISDPEAEMEQLRSAVDIIQEDVSLIKQAQYFIYYDTRKIKRKFQRSQQKKRKSDN